MEKLNPQSSNLIALSLSFSSYTFERYFFNYLFLNIALATLCVSFYPRCNYNVIIMIVRYGAMSFFKTRELQDSIYLIKYQKGKSEL